MAKKFFYSALVFGGVMAVLSVFVTVSQFGVAVADEGTATALAQSAAASQVESTTVGDAPNVSTVQDKIFFSGQPTAASLLGFREKGVKTVINLRTETEMQALDFDESKLVESLGMKYINIPIGRDEPSDETISFLMNTIETSSLEPMLMHCASSTRVGYAWAMYRGTRGGESVQDAIEQGKKAGMHSPVLEERVSNYIARQLKKSDTKK